MQILCRFCVGVAMVLFFFANPVVANDKLPSGRIAVEGTSMSLLLGFTRGEGTLHYNGYAYPFSIRGFSLLSIGASKLDGLGVVYDLNDVTDFSGRYWSAQGNLTAIQGGGSTIMKNDKGVVIQLDSRQVGVEFGLGGGSIDIELDTSISPLPAGNATSQSGTKLEPAVGMVDER